MDASALEKSARRAGRLTAAQDPLSRHPFKPRTLELLHEADIWNMGELRAALVAGLASRVPALRASGLADVDAVVRQAGPSRFTRHILNTVLAQSSLPATLLATLLRHDVRTLSALEKGYAAGTFFLVPWLQKKDVIEIEKVLGFAVSGVGLTSRERIMAADVGLTDLNQLRGLTQVELHHRYRRLAESLIEVLTRVDGRAPHFDDLERAVSERALNTPMKTLGYAVPMTLEAVITAIEAGRGERFDSILRTHPEVIDKVRATLRPCESELSRTAK